MLLHVEVTGEHVSYDLMHHELIFHSLELLQALDTLHLSHANDAIPLTWNDAFCSTGVDVRLRAAALLQLHMHEF